MRKPVIFIQSIFLALFIFGIPAESAGVKFCAEEMRQIPLLSQNDRRLETAGYWHEGKSFLCGPTCIINALNIARSVVGLPAPDPIEEMATLITRIENQFKLIHMAGDPRTGTSHQIISEVIVDVFTSVNLPIEVGGRIVIPSPLSDEKRGNITFEDFPTQADGRNQTLIEVNGGPKWDMNIAYQPELQHFMLVVKFDPATKTLTIIDPFKPDLPLHGKLESLEGQTFKIVFDRPLHSEIKDFVFFINGVITIRPKHL